MKTFFYDGFPNQGLFRGQRAGRFLKKTSHRSGAGVPHLEGGGISYLIEKEETIPGYF